jgi:hypothetical protein
MKEDILQQSSACLDQIKPLNQDGANFILNASPTWMQGNSNAVLNQEMVFRKNDGN